MCIIECVNLLKIFEIHIQTEECTEQGLWFIKVNTPSNHYCAKKQNTGNSPEASFMIPLSHYPISLPLKVNTNHIFISCFSLLFYYFNL